MYDPGGVWDSLFTDRPKAAGRGADMAVAELKGRSLVRWASKLAGGLLLRSASLSYLGVMVLPPLVALGYESTSRHGRFHEGCAERPVRAPCPLADVRDGRRDGRHSNAVTGTATAWVSSAPVPGKGL